MTQPGAMLYTQGFGSRAENVEVPHLDTRDPSSYDVNYPVGKTWINQSSNTAFTLTSISASQGSLTANWQSTTSSSGISVINVDSGSTIQNNSTVKFTGFDPDYGNYLAGKTVSFFGTNDHTLTMRFSDDSGNTCLGQDAKGNGNCTSIGYQANFKAGEFGSDSNNTISIGHSAGRFCYNSQRCIYIGNEANLDNVAGQDNDSIMIGYRAGRENSNGSRNIGIGTDALYTTGGTDNVAIGYQSLIACDGDFNISIGSGSGSAYGAGSESSNILISSAGVATDSNVIRIGTQGNMDGEQDTCYIAGIFGSTVDAGSGTAAFVDANGQLGTVVSSVRFKENIESLSNESELLYKLRPVIFSYKTDETHKKVYGLIAEEVKEIAPDLVVYDKESQPYSVKYHDLPVLLLKEIQKLKEEIELLKAKI